MYLLNFIFLKFNLTLFFNINKLNVISPNSVLILNRLGFNLAKTS